jgi:hypothetical protein
MEFLITTILADRKQKSNMTKCSPGKADFTEVHTHKEHFVYYIDVHELIGALKLKFPNSGPSGT